MSTKHRVTIYTVWIGDRAFQSSYTLDRIVEVVSWLALAGSEQVKVTKRVEMRYIADELWERIKKEVY